MKFFRLALHWQILIALVLAVLVGAFLEPATTLFGISFGAVFNFVGKGIYGKTNATRRVVWCALRIPIAKV